MQYLHNKHHFTRRFIVLMCAVMMIGLSAPAGAQENEERKILVNRLELMQFALPALMEAERHEAVDALCRAIHAYEVMLKDRSDTTARIIRARAPKDEQLVKLLSHAGELYREFNANDKADTIQRNIESLWKRRHQGREDDRHPARQRERNAMTEREIGQQQVEIMRLGLPALREAGRRDTAELLEHAIHARELALEGRRDDEAVHIRESAPKLGAQIEILNYAAKLWEDFGHEDKARQLHELAERYRRTWQRRRGGDNRSERPHRSEDEKALALRQLERMRYALGAFRETEAGDAADLMYRAIRAREVVLEGRDDREARVIVDHAPQVGMQIELLQRASGILREFGAKEKAHAVNEVAEQLAAQQRAHRAETSPRRDRDSNPNVTREIDQLKEILAKLQMALQDVRDRLSNLEREIR